MYLIFFSLFYQGILSGLFAICTKQNKWAPFYLQSLEMRGDAMRMIPQYNGFTGDKMYVQKNNDCCCCCLVVGLLSDGLLLLLLMLDFALCSLTSVIIRDLWHKEDSHCKTSSKLPSISLQFATHSRCLHY